MDDYSVGVIKNKQYKIEGGPDLLGTALCC